MALSGRPSVNFFLKKV